MIFSIIIPHCNTPNLLDRCLSSIPKRTDIEVIVIEDERRRGAGYARNIGLTKAKGKWLIFADADDFFLNPAFENALEQYADSDADMICFANTVADSNDVSKEIEHPQFDMYSKIAKVAHHCGLDACDIIRYDCGVVWCRFIKRELVERINARFQETICRNDTFFAVQIGCNAGKIILDNTEIYCYTQRQNSILSAFETKKGQKIRYFVSKSVMKYLRKQGKGFHSFNGDLVFHYNLLQRQNKLLYIKELIPVLLLAVTKKAVAKEFFKYFFTKK
ncbi:MAG: glycosyltransferase family 2 protein [Dysgonamonadaceae bacterium]|jgi:glycosyltransferase involved in cell wall biosynthesis|nr:glycosyltransferase family 2 protein [Dysgonamonadaceae bacterium]